MMCQHLLALLTSVIVGIHRMHILFLRLEFVCVSAFLSGFSCSRVAHHCVLIEAQAPQWAGM